MKIQNDSQILIFCNKIFFLTKMNIITTSYFTNIRQQIEEGENIKYNKFSLINI